MDELRFHGKNLDELKEMGIKEFSLLLKSRQRRSLQRGFTEPQKSFLKKLEKKNNVKTHCRDIIVIPSMVGKLVRLYNGKEYVAITITEEMLGHFMGELVLTRKMVKHSSPGVGATRSSASVSVR